MESKPPVIGRIEKALGPAAATMFVESGTSDRHFVIEGIVTMVALYLGGQFLDGFVGGFVEGTGVPELGKKLGEKARSMIGFSKQALDSPESVDRKEMQRQIQELTQAVADLRALRPNTQATAAGVGRVRQALEEQGLPRGEAQKISGQIEVALWHEL